MTKLRHFFKEGNKFDGFRNTIEEMERYDPSIKGKTIDEVLNIGTGFNTSNIDWDNYPNFSEIEFTCKCGCGTMRTTEQVIAFCQDLRDSLGEPIRIVSGTRCKKHNKRVGGAKRSGHVDGTEVDILAGSSQMRHAILKKGFEHNANRFGIYKRQGFVHVGFSKTLPQDVIWVG